LLVLKCVIEHKDIAAAIDKRVRAELLPAKKAGSAEAPATAAVADEEEGAALQA